MSALEDYLLARYGGIDHPTALASAPAASPLSIPTSPGSGEEAIHPSVVKFGSKWPDANGYLYWLALTPYPDNQRENPEIVASDDGEAWEVPSGLTNPIDASPGGSSDFNADTCLFYDSSADELWCYYLSDVSGSVTIHRRTSSDGTTWAAEEDVLSPTATELSPTVVKVSTTYYMWVVDTTNDDLVRYDSTDGATWGNRTVCTIDDIPWHIEVRYISSESTYLLLAQAGQNQSNLYWWTSSDGTTFSFSSACVLRAQASPAYGTKTAWDHEDYRATFWEDGGTIEIWYSAHVIDAGVAPGDGGDWATGKAADRALSDLV